MKGKRQSEAERIMEGLEGRPRLLLHSCCGPCSSYALEYLSRHFELTILYYNPNIQPEAEFEKRLETQKQLLAGLPYRVALLESGHRGGDFDKTAAGLEKEPEGGARCAACFALRLGETARIAAEGGFDFFATTLSVSPHKNAELLNKIGAELSEIWHVKWLPLDLKKRGGYARSVELAGEYGLYRQNYCGCLFSKAVDFF